MNSKILAWNIRRDVLNMVHAAHASHTGSAFSIADKENKALARAKEF